MANTKKRTFKVEISGPEGDAMNYSRIGEIIHSELHRVLNENIAWYYDKYVNIKVTEEE